MSAYGTVARGTMLIVKTPTTTSIQLNTTTIDVGFDTIMTVHTTYLRQLSLIILDYLRQLSLTILDYLRQISLTILDYPTQLS